MATWVKNSPVSFIGRNSAYDVLNDDAGAPWRKTCCGQAATLSAVATARNWVKPHVTLGNILANSRYHPDNGFGFFGTSWQRVTHILSEKFSANFTYIRGMAALRQEMKMHRPVLCMLDVGTTSRTGIAGHWTCVYGITKYNVMLTNWSQPGYDKDAERAIPIGEGACFENVCPIGTFEAGWDTWLTRLGGFNNWGISVVG